MHGSHAVVLQTSKGSLIWCNLPEAPARVASVAACVGSETMLAASASYESPEDQAKRLKKEQARAQKMKKKGKKVNMIDPASVNVEQEKRAEVALTKYLGDEKNGVDSVVKYYKTASKSNDEELKRSVQNVLVQMATSSTPERAYRAVCAVIKCDLLELAMTRIVPHCREDQRVQLLAARPQTLTWCVVSSKCTPALMVDALRTHLPQEKIEITLKQLIIATDLHREVAPKDLVGTPVPSLSELMSFLGYLIDAKFAEIRFMPNAKKISQQLMVVVQTFLPPLANTTKLYAALQLKKNLKNISGT